MNKLQPAAPNVALSILLCAAVLSGETASAFDFDTGNAAFEIVIQTAAPVIVSADVSPTGGDAPLVLRVTTMVTNAWFDAAAPYDPNGKAVGVYTRLGHQPPPPTHYEMNVALLYASYQVLNSLLPHRAAVWDNMLLDIGLDPRASDTTDLTTPEGIGTAAGIGVVEGRLRDGMNQIGDERNRTYNPVPYKDYTDYKPVNTAYRLLFPLRWQPDSQRTNLGNYRIQEFVTPQYALVEPYSYPDPKAFSLPAPIHPRGGLLRQYKQQADEVLQASADLNDERKLMAELFDNKIAALGFSAVFAGLSQGLSLFEFISLDFVTNMAAFDAGVFVWQEKRRYDSVRPFSAIRFLYKDRTVTAWGGPGRGTVNDIPASEWQSYLEEADHPEYPSASTCFCHAHAQASRLFLPWGDTLNWSVPMATGSSRIEPGITPATDTVLEFPTWSQFADDCGQSRVWAGVHFQAAVDESAKICSVFGDSAHGYVQSLLNGSAPSRPPSKGLDR